MARYKKSGMKHSKRKNWKKMIKGKTRATGKALREKHYPFNFHLDPLYISNAQQVTAGHVVVTPVLSQLPIQLSNITASGTCVTSASLFANYYDFGVGVEFSLKNITNADLFQKVFQQYRINYIDVKIEYLATGTGVAGVGLMPTMYAYVTDNTSLIPTDVNAVNGRQGVKVCRFGDKNKNVYTIRIRPKVAVQLFNPDTQTQPLANTGYMEVKDGWLDTVSVAQGIAVPDETSHYGMQLWFADVLLPGATGSVNTAFKFEYRYNISFKSPINEY
jgi:hypothetical protein